MLYAPRILNENTGCRSSRLSHILKVIISNPVPFCDRLRPRLTSLPSRADRFTAKVNGVSVRFNGAEYTFAKPYISKRENRPLYKDIHIKIMRR